MTTILQQFKDEVRCLAIYDFYDGTGRDAGHWKACRLCEWVWRYDDPELHEPSCPLREETP